jgi:hypothetical protein
VDALVEKSFLNRYEKMVGHDAKKDVGMHALFAMMKDRPLGERQFHVSEGSLGGVSRT